MNPADPPTDCRICPRLSQHRDVVAVRHPDWFNGAVPDLGDPDARMLIVGLAPGLRGGNRTGMPFTGDASGDALFSALRSTGFAEPGDSTPPALTDCMITNAVRCLPPDNKPKAVEINSCRRFLAGRIAAMPNLVAILCLGRIAHETTCRALGLSLADHAFAHGAMHNTHRVALFDTYHCSRYNMNTGRLTPEMFRAVIVRLHAYIGEV